MLSMAILTIERYLQGIFVEGIKEEVVLSPAHALSLIAAGEGTNPLLFFVMQWQPKEKGWIKSSDGVFVNDPLSMNSLFYSQKNLWTAYCHSWTHAIDFLHCQNIFVTGWSISIPKVKIRAISFDYVRVVCETKYLDCLSSIEGLIPHCALFLTPFMKFCSCFF